LLILNVS